MQTVPNLDFVSGARRGANLKPQRKVIGVMKIRFGGGVPQSVVAFAAVRIAQYRSQAELPWTDFAHIVEQQESGKLHT